MSCEACANILEVDGFQPDCVDGDCLIPKLEPAASRIMAIRTLLIGLNQIVDAGTICRLANVDADDLHLLNIVEGILKEPKRGERCQADHQG